VSSSSGIENTILPTIFPRWCCRFATVGTRPLNLVLPAPASHLKKFFTNWGGVDKIRSPYTLATYKPKQGEQKWQE
jgi:hypothetical protein